VDTEYPDGPLLAIEPFEALPLVHPEESQGVDAASKCKPGSNDSFPDPEAPDRIAFQHVDSLPLRRLPPTRPALTPYKEEIPPLCSSCMRLGRLRSDPLFFSRPL
jgi:hypothetical protein